MVHDHRSSAAAAVGACQHSDLRGLHRNRQVVHVGERLGDDAVVGPAALFPISHEPGLLENPQVKREARLRCREIVLEIAHAVFTAPQPFYDLETGCIRERVKELGGARQIESCRGRHGCNVSTFFVPSRGRLSAGTFADLSLTVTGETSGVRSTETSVCREGSLCHGEIATSRTSPGAWRQWRGNRREMKGGFRYQKVA